MRTLDGRVVEGPLVLELAEDGTLLSYHPLRQEEPETEWIGGDYTLSIEH